MSQFLGLGLGFPALSARTASRRDEFGRFPPLGSFTAGSQASDFDHAERFPTMSR